MKRLLPTRLLFLCSTLFVVTAFDAVNPATLEPVLGDATIDPLLSTSETIEDGDPTKYPYLVSVLIFENKPKDRKGPVLLSHSAGVLISSNYILETKPNAKCNECIYSVRMWSDGDGLVVSETKADLIQHENYTKIGNSGFTSPNNIALYKLRVPIKFHRRAQAVNLPRLNEKIVSGERGTLVDWAVEEGWGKIDSRVRETNITMIDRQGCSDLLEQADQVLRMDGLHELPEGFFCAKSKIYCEDCLEDHSSKLFVGNRLFGLSDRAVSMFIGDRYFRVSVFVDVARYRDWIKNYVGV